MDTQSWITLAGLLVIPGGLIGWFISQYQRAEDRRYQQLALSEQNRAIEAQRLEDQRAHDLRVDEVLSWGKDAIDAVQSVYLLCSTTALDESEQRTHLFELGMRCSILLEQGRLFFKNQIVNDWGNQKEKAYKGYRPVILDQLLISHLVAIRWSDLGADQEFGAKIAEKAAKKLVSLLQAEVGRSETAATETGLGGRGIALEELIEAERTQMKGGF